MIDTAGTLGPATALAAAEGDGVEVRLPDGPSARARLAFAVPYRPRAGDELLVIGQGGDLYAIGVLKAAGPVELRCEGGFEVRAEGPVSLVSRRSLAVEAPDVAIRAGRLELAAQRTVQRFRDAYLWLSGLFQVKSRRLRATAEEGLFARGGRTHLKSDGDLSIDGKTIHLG